MIEWSADTHPGPDRESRRSPHANAPRNSRARPRSAATPLTPAQGVTHMPMSRDERIERVQRLQTAHKTTKEAMESKPATWELHPGTDIARNWPVITAAYSGLEQTLKFLIAEQKGLTIAELIDLSAPPNGRLDERNSGRHPYRTHDLAWLFSKFDERTRDVVRDFYGRFRSLHSYVTVALADEFLKSDFRSERRWLRALALHPDRRQAPAEEQPRDPGRHLGGVRSDRRGASMGESARTNARPCIDGAILPIP